MRLQARARWRWVRRQLRPELIAGIVVIIVFALATHRRNNVWRSEVGIFGDAASKSPMKHRPLLNAGVAWRKAGNTENAARYFEAARRLPYPTTYEIKLHYAAQTNLANIYIERRQYQAAFDLANDSLQHSATPDTMNTMAFLMLVAGRPDQTIYLTDQILNGNFNGGWRLRTSLWAWRGQAFQKLGDCNNAMAAYVAIKYLKPDFQIPACP